MKRMKGRVVLEEKHIVFKHLFTSVLNIIIWNFGTVAAM